MCHAVYPQCIIVQRVTRRWVGALDNQVGHRRGGRLEVRLVERRVGAAFADDTEALLDAREHLHAMQCTWSIVHMQCTCRAHAHAHAVHMQSCTCSAYAHAEFEAGAWARESARWHRGPRRASRAVAAGRRAATAAKGVVGKEAAMEEAETAAGWVAERVAEGGEVVTGAAMAAEGWEAARGVAAKAVATTEEAVAVGLADRQLAQLVDT